MIHIPHQAVNVVGHWWNERHDNSNQTVELNLT